MYNKLALILGNELFEDHSKLSPDSKTLFFMAEDYDLCTHFNYHKHKLVLFLSAMRHHRDFISKDYDIEYVELTKEITYLEKLSKVLKKHSINKIVTYTIEDHFFRKQIEEFCEENSIELEVVESPSFLTSGEDFEKYRESYNRLFFTDFYVWQRKRLKVLVDDYDKPIKGKWSFDQENRKKLPKDYSSPNLLSIEKTKHVNEVSKLVEEVFSNHPGSTDNFYLPVTYEDSKKWLKDFLENKFEDFGPYEDAFDKEEVFINHSVLSPLINLGLLTPKYILDETITYFNKNKTHYPSVEGFVRQLIGWREFIRGTYNTQDFEKNFFNHKRKLTKDWYEGTTGIEPLNDAIKKVQKYGFLHHIERLMVVGNIMLLSEIHPSEVNKWFMELFVDSSDWVMIPNVYGMSQFADGGSFATKPYIAGSNYVRKMSHYKQDDWCEVMDGLYWRFIDKNKDVFKSNQRMSMMVKLLEKMDEKKKKRIFKKAENFITKKTKN